MSKPPFTVDPPPVNATDEERMRWIIEQFYRIEDWWPRDSGSRLDRLERLVDAVPGQVEFGAKGTFYFPFDVGNVTKSLNCGTPIGYYSTVRVEQPQWIEYADYTGKIYVSGGTNNATDPIIEINPADGTASDYTGQNGYSRHGHRIVSTNGSISDKRYLAVIESTGVGDRYFNVYDLDDGTQLCDVSLGGANAGIIGENTGYVWTAFRGGTFKRVTKSTWSVSSPLTITDWSAPDNHICGATVSETEVLVAVQKDSDSSRFGFVKATNGTLGSTVNEITEMTFQSLEGIEGHGVKVGQNVYWPANQATSTGRARILKTDLDGNYVADFPAKGTSTDNFTITGDASLALDADNNALFYSSDATLYRFEIATGIVESCTIGTPDGWGVPSYAGHTVYLENNCWVIEDLIDGNNLGIVKKPVY